MDKLELVKFIVELLMQLVLIIVPIVLAFLQKDKAKWEKVVGSIPDVVELVEKTMKDLPGADKKEAALKEVEAMSGVSMKGRSLSLADRHIEATVARMKRQG